MLFDPSTYSSKLFSLRNLNNCRFHPHPIPINVGYDVPPSKSNLAPSINQPLHVTGFDKWQIGRDVFISRFENTLSVFEDLSGRVGG